jgi:hypothetical protein
LGEYSGLMKQKAKKTPRTQINGKFNDTSSADENK